MRPSREMLCAISSPPPPCFTRFVPISVATNAARPGILGVEAQLGGKCADAASGWRDGTRIADRKLLHLLPTRNGHASAYAGLRPDIEFV